MGSPFHKAVVTALKDCIAAHGPIDKTFVSSAAKRIMRYLMEAKAFQGIVPDDVREMLRQMGKDKLGLAQHRERRRIGSANDKMRRLRAELKILREKTKDNGLE